MSARGARVIILCRSIDKGKEAVEEIFKETGKTVEVEKLDLASLKSVRECAQKLLEKEEKIDILVNNAGIMTCPNWKTEDGFDMQLGTNHLGHFLLTEMLLPLLKKSAATGFHPRYGILYLFS
jgi:retinol dehydrogenase-12